MSESMQGDDTPGAGRERAPNPHRYGWAEMLTLGIAMNAAAQLLGPPAAARSEYARSTRPPFAPPAWLFGVAWPINNFLTLWGNRHVLNSPPSPDRTAYLRLQAATWALFMTYGLARFRLKSPILGYANAVLYLSLTLASAVRVSRIDRSLLASYATLIPWLVLATTLSAYQLGDPDPLLDGFHHRA
ncbi:MAG TPA: TspO/MBR family protein [Candidatus Tumulicola sp.]